MKTNTTLLFLLIFASIVASCEKEDFSTTAEVDLSEYGNQLVVLAPFKTDVTLDIDRLWYNHFYLVLMKSTDILDDSRNFERIKDAVVDLYEDGQYSLSLEHKHNGIYISDENTGIEAGKNYKIEIHSPEYGKVTAQSYVPNRPNNLKAYVSDSSYYDALEGIEKVEITLEMEDEPNVENFYFLTVKVVLKTDSMDYNRFPIFTYKDPIFDEGDVNTEYIEAEEFLEAEGLIRPHPPERTATFKDVLFEGQHKRMKIYVNKNDLEELAYYDSNTGALVKADVDIHLVVGSMSRDLYLYKRSALSQSRISANPFAEAVRVYSNIEGGIGIFGGFVETAVIVE